RNRAEDQGVHATRSRDQARNRGGQRQQDHSRAEKEANAGGPQRGAEVGATYSISRQYRVGEKVLRQDQRRAPIAPQRLIPTLSVCDSGRAAAQASVRSLRCPRRGTTVEAGA